MMPDIAKRLKESRIVLARRSQSQILSGLQYQQTGKTMWAKSLED